MSADHSDDYISVQDETVKWNMKLNFIMSHLGRHPNKYHDWVLDMMRSIDSLADGDTEAFLEMWDELVKKYIMEHPEKLTKAGWN